MRRLLLSLFALLFLGNAAASVSPDFHHWLHGQEAEHSEDGCFIDLLASGSFSSETAPSPPLVRPQEQPGQIEFLPPTQDAYRLLTHHGTWENAPPAGLS